MRERGRARSSSWAHRASAAAGVIGPGLFTLSWIVNGGRQSAYSITDEHISGLAAVDADHPEAMMAGFVALGASTILFSRELRRVLGGRQAGWGPAVLGLGGAAAVAAGLLRRDTVLLNPPDRPADYVQSWHNDGHDLAAAVIYTSTVVAPLLLARRFAGDPAWRSLVPVAVVSSVASLVLMAVFATDVDRPGNGVVQRVMVTLPQAFMIALALRMATATDRPRPSS